MAKRKPPENSQGQGYFPSQLSNLGEGWQTRIENITQRFEAEYSGKKLDLPSEVKEIDIFEQWQSGSLQNRISSQFWKLKTPKKKESWLDVGCGLSFLIYPWYQWDAAFFGQEISKTARDTLMSRGPQLNSKLFKGVKLSPAHILSHEENHFDGVIATGWSCYYALDYWETVIAEVKKVLKPQGCFIFDAIDPESPLAEDWAILETYLGAEVLLTPLTEWEGLIKKTGGKIVKSSSNDLFQIWQVNF